MKKSALPLLVIVCLSMLIHLACRSKRTDMEPKKFIVGTFGYDVNFFKDLGIDIIELKDSISGSSVLIVPAYQGRVMTSSTSGYDGISFGWIKYDLIRSGTKNPQFNPYGGEERIWLGPEGGKYSIYFPKDSKQIFDNWKVPDVLDTEAFEVVSADNMHASFKKDFNLINYSGVALQVGVERSVEIMSRAQIESAMGFSLNQNIRFVAYESENVLINRGTEQWSERTGLLSIWMLSMFRPSDNGTVVIPFKTGNKKDLGPVANTDYFGSIPPDRLVMSDDKLFFKVDGRFRSKIGIPPSRALPWCGSYDEDNNTLTLLWYSKPEGEATYVNSKWDKQDDPLKGDVINSYNDGPVENGSIMGPFYEIESSSPAAMLKPGEKLTHRQRIFHLTGTEEELSPVSQKILGIPVSQIKEVF